MIKGFRGTSLVDYPGLISAVVFFGGCNFRCPFCYNIDLVQADRLKKLPDFSEEYVLKELLKRQGFIQGLVITGGEPTLYPRLLQHLLEMVRTETQLKIKLDTNGSHPEVVARLWDLGLVDYVALDFKTSPERYPELGGRWEPVAQTISILVEKGIPHEMRLTMVPYFIGRKDLRAMAPWLKRASRVVLQRFLDHVERLRPDMELGLYGPDELKDLKSFVEQETPGEVLLRV